MAPEKQTKKPQPSKTPEGKKQDPKKANNNTTSKKK